MNKMKDKKLKRVHTESQLTQHNSVQL